MNAVEEKDLVERLSREIKGLEDDIRETQRRRSALRRELDAFTAALYVAVIYDHESRGVRYKIVGVTRKGSVSFRHLSFEFESGGMCARHNGVASIVMPDDEMSVYCPLGYRCRVFSLESKAREWVAQELLRILEDRDSAMK